ncbi:MAG: Stp1/IreP family PP2C-type Ser/Thr phosphatase [Tissierellia bacterium]|nr:Stp1/IreP family PP2C-type Ser/Thr phosphatase [Tissierellia bacterium]
MKYESLSDTGILRKLNEDSYDHYENKDFLLLVVADGMGGHKAGEIASSLAVKEFIRYFKEEDVDLNQPFEEIKRAISSSNEKVYEKSLENEEMSNMGTTIVGALIKDDTVFVVNVGDSRCYILNKYGFKQISRDHSLVNDLLISGMITEEEAEEFSQKNVITRSIGVAEEVEAEMIALDLSSGDYLLLCSDGLNNQVDEEDIVEVLEEDTDLKEKCYELIEMANDYGGIDNTTVTIYRHGGDKK